MKGISRLLSKRVIISGDNLVDAQPRVDNQTNETVVTFNLDRIGAKKFGKATTTGVGKRLAIVLDGKKWSIFSSMLLNCNDKILLTNKINYKIYSLGVLLRINLDISFDIVHRSNMSKVCKDKETAILTVENYKNNDTR